MSRWQNPSCPDGRPWIRSGRRRRQALTETRGAAMRAVEALTTNGLFRGQSRGSSTSCGTSPRPPTQPNAIRSDQSRLRTCQGKPPVLGAGAVFSAGVVDGGTDAPDAPDDAGCGGRRGGARCPSPGRVRCSNRPGPDRVLRWRRLGAGHRRAGQPSSTWRSPTTWAIPPAIRLRAVPAAIYLQTSTNRGRTFGAPHAVWTQPVGGTSYPAQADPSVAVDAAGNVYVSFLGSVQTAATPT